MADSERRGQKSLPLLSVRKPLSSRMKDPDKDQDYKKYKKHLTIIFNSEKGGGIKLRILNIIQDIGIKSNFAQKNMLRNLMVFF